MSLPQLQRYNELKELSLKQSAVLGQQAEKLDWKIKADHEQLALDQRRKNEVEVLQVALLDFTNQMIIVNLVKDSKFFFFFFSFFCQAANRTHKTQLEDLIIRAEKVEEYTKTCRLSCDLNCIHV